MPYTLRQFIRIAAFFGIAAASIAQTQVPVVDQLPDMEVTARYAEKDYPVYTYVTATNSPTHFQATGAPFVLNEETYNGQTRAYFYWSYGRLGGGDHTVSITASNAAGTSAPMTFHWIIHPGMTWDFIRPDNTTYHPGDLITLKATFSAPVVVTGSPYIQLWGTKKAVYSSGSGTTTLLFTYRVTNDDPRVSRFSVTDITAGDGSIATPDGVSASLHDTYYGLGEAPPAFDIVDPAPAPDAVSSISVLRTQLSNTVKTTMTFTHDVTVTGTPLLHVTVGGVARTAPMTSHGTNSIVFLYTAQPGDNGPFALQSPIDLNGGTITGSNGLAVNLEFNPPDTAAIVVDTTPPAPPNITSFTSSGTPSFTGTTEPKASVIITSGTRSTSRTANADGTFTIGWTDPALPAGTYTFYLRARDDWGNTSDPSPPMTITAAYPTKLTTPIITGVDASGIVSGTADPGTLVNLFVDAYFFFSASGTTKADGTWSVHPLFGLSDSPAVTVTAAAYDAAKNVSGLSAPFTYTPGTASQPPGGTTPQTITFSSPTGAVRVGQPIQLGATSSAGLPITYSVISGDATISGSVLTPQSTATLIVRASSPGDATYAAASTDVNFGNPIPVGNSRLVNISARVRVSAGDASGATIAGFFVTGTTPKQILIRGVGPSLTQFGITNPVTAPQLKLYNDKNAVMATNAGWNNDASIAAAGDAVAAFQLNANSTDSALLMTLAPGLYTAQVQSGNTGTALIEVYDVGSADPNPTKQLINISTRGYVGTDQDVLVAGFVVSGDAPKRVLIRGAGPGITQFGVDNVLSDPVLKVYDAKQTVIAQNDNWETPQAIGANDTPANAAQITAGDTSAGAFPLATGSTDAALIATLNPGQYTAIVSGASGGTGNAIVEVYELP